MVENEAAQSLGRRFANAVFPAANKDRRSRPVRAPRRPQREKEFERKLDGLWHRRKEEIIKGLVIRRRGKPKSFNRAIRNKEIESLQKLATEILIKNGAWNELKSHVIKRKLCHLRKWRGGDHRYEQLKEWAKKNVKGPNVYSFWRNGKCLYVGKGRSPQRFLQPHRPDFIKEADQVEIYLIHPPKALAKVECLAVHLLDPKHNKNRPSGEQWGKKCPICEIHNQISSELRTVFSFR